MHAYKISVSALPNIKIYFKVLTAQFFEGGIYSSKGKFFFCKNQCQLGSTSSYVIFALFQTHFPTTKPYSRKGAIKISPQDENEPKHVQPSKVQI